MLTLDRIRDATPQSRIAVFMTEGWIKIPNKRRRKITKLESIFADTVNGLARIEEEDPNLVGVFDGTKMRGVAKTLLVALNSEPVKDQ